MKPKSNVIRREMRVKSVFSAVAFVFSLSVARDCKEGTKLHSFKDGSERCCQTVRVPVGYERRICSEEYGEAEYEQCPANTYQDIAYPSNISMYCKEHLECVEPNMVIVAPGNSTSNYVCKCNEDKGYYLDDDGTDVYAAYLCKYKGSNKSQVEHSGIDATTELPSNTTETAVVTTMSSWVVLLIAFAFVIIVIVIVVVTVIVVRQRRRNIVCNGHLAINGTRPFRTPSSAETAEFPNTVQNGRLILNETHSPSSAGLFETDQQQCSISLHDERDSSLCDVANS